MIDYSRIDWVKCKLKPLPCLMADGETQQLTVQAAWDASHGNAVITVSGYHMMAKTGSGSIGWKFLHCNVASTADQALELIERAKEVNAFITAETARIEAEDEAKNWAAVPWQDVEFLVKSGARVVADFGSNIGTFVAIGDMVATNLPHRADKRTFPPGYDPEKPRWVKIHKDDARRLSDAGARVQRKMSWSNDNWMDMTSTERGTPYDYRIDIHTLPPGVPLHEEPKPVPMPGSHSPHHEFTYDLGEIPSLHVLVNGKTFAGHSLTDFSGKRVKIQVDLADDKPAPRPCSKEFALSHPEESECRNFGEEFDSGWKRVSFFSYNARSTYYEFRTTAKAEKHPIVLLELPMNARDVSDVTFHFDSEAAALINKLSSDKKSNPRIALIVDEE